MEILSYKNASDIPEEFLPSLVESEIECWWSEPFSEYMICENCKWIYSIEDVYWSIKNYKIRKKNKQFECKCWCEIIFMYQKDKYLDLLTQYFKWKVSAVLLVDNIQVKGFWVLTKSNLADIIYNHIDYRPNSYNKEKVIQLISQKIFWIDDAKKKDFIYSNHIYVAPSHRLWNISFELLKTISNLNNEEYKNLPVIWETKYKSKFYPISRIMWYTDIMPDKYWNVLQSINKYGNVTNFFNTNDSFFNNESLKDMLKYINISSNILKLNPNFSNRKFYT